MGIISLNDGLVNFFEYDDTVQRAGSGRSNTDGISHPS